MARIVVALGGNALQTGGAVSADDQKKVVRETAKQLVALVRDGHDLIIGHGNGPQVGNILLHEESCATPESPAMPLETDVAMSQGQIGYWLQQALGDELRKSGIHKNVVTVVSQTVVDESDPAFANPSKPIGPFYDETTAKSLSDQRGWVVVEDSGRGWRRVVPSPMPVDIVEREVVKNLADSGTIVIAAGGGGIPVVRKNGELIGVDAVIDKDFAAAEMAKMVEASVLLILTTVANVVVDFNTPESTPIRETTVDEMNQHILDHQFAPGSMLPKVQAALSFAQHRPENVAIITSPEMAIDAMGGGAGTVVKNATQ